MSRQVFQGFPEGKLSFALIPDLFFSELLPGINDMAELKVTLHVMWLLQRRRTKPCWVSQDELEADPVLLRSLASTGREPLTALRRGLRAAVERGTLIALAGEVQGRATYWYVLNSRQGRRLVARAERGEQLLPGVLLRKEDSVPAPRPNIFSLYEQNIGLLQPILAEELEEAANKYPPDWVEEAFRLAAQSNARSWRYVRAILERWEREGKRRVDIEDAEARRRRYIEGEYKLYRES